MGLKDKILKEVLFAKEKIPTPPGRQSLLPMTMKRHMKILARRYFNYHAENQTPIEEIRRFFGLSQVLEVLQNCDEDNARFAPHLYQYLDRNFDKELQNYQLG